MLWSSLSSLVCCLKPSCHVGQRALEAGRLIGASAQDVLRWTRGSGANDPIWRAHYQFLDDTTELSFVDLIELRVVRALRKREVSLQAIRYAISLAKEKFQIDRPLSSRQFKTDGAEILMDAVEGDGELVSLSKRNPGQKVFSKIVDQSVSGLEYDNNNVARWRPTSAGHVVIDPRRIFGTPILDQNGISTGALYREWRATPDIKKLSRIYEIPEVLIKDAIGYEEHLSKMPEPSSGQSSI